MGEFLATLFLTRELAHRYHLFTKSYSQHKALGRFYEELLELIDDLAEMWQGKEGIIDIPILTAKQGTDAVYFVAGKLDYVEKNRYKVATKEDTAIQNKIDEIVELFLSTLYKLENLK